MVNNSDKGSVTRLLSGAEYWHVPKRIVREFGIEAGILLPEMLWLWDYYADENGWFYRNQKALEKATTLSPYQQKQAVDKMVKAGLLKVKKVGLPAQNHYKIIENKLLKIFSTREQNLLGHKYNNIINNNSSKEEELKENQQHQQNKSPNKKKRIRKKLPTVFRKKEKPIEESRKKTLFEKAPAEDKNIILQWNRHKAGSRHSNKNSGLIRDTLKLLPKLRKGYDYEDIIDAIIYHAQFGNNGKISILNFFQINHYQKQYLQKKNEPIQSPFQKIVECKEFKEFRRTRNYPKDIYNEIVEYWRKHIAVEDVEFTAKQKNHFKLTAVKLKKYMKGRRLEKYIDGCKAWDYVNMLFHALDWWWADGRYTTANFCSDFTFNDTLPRYISEEFEE